MEKFNASDMPIKGDQYRLTTLEVGEGRFLDGSLTKGAVDSIVSYYNNKKKATAGRKFSSLKDGNFWKVWRYQ